MKIAVLMVARVVVLVVWGLSAVYHETNLTKISLVSPATHLSA